ncbi:MAG TPA: adenylate/guanylate cyclase domain-containing protein [Candidatus Rifleibacterium sp.]|nr:adenylate/guanylate cyclase domain-containing protein [Candidatus Rifleibacterium sp.]HPT47658.1 adenylate/guanylate cyclase domain-containing protein [Candidatus Rifleibacterium sp.]
MKKYAETRLLVLLLAGFIVLAAPLLFFNDLLTTAVQRSTDSAMALLREKMLQETAKVKTLLKPAFFIKEIIRKAHAKALPGVTADLIKMQPAKDYGKELFNENLPDRLRDAMQAQRVDPLFIAVVSPAFAGIYHWFAETLLAQCPEPMNLATAIACRLIGLSGQLYEQYYQRSWRNLGLHASMNDLIEFNFQKSAALEFKYLNRFTEFDLLNDTVKEVFTDYFGRQSIYYYAYGCVSRKNIHGGYVIGVLQSAIEPAMLLKNALQNNSEQIEAELIDLALPRSGFFEERGTLFYFDRPPTEFWNHFFFTKRLQKQRYTDQTGRYHLRLKAPPPREIIEMKNYQRLFRLISGFLLLCYLMAALHFWLFGLNLRLAIRRKLLLLLAIIIFIPVTGVGFLTAISIKGSGRLIENHVLLKTEEFIREFVINELENSQHQQLAMLETKRRLEEYQNRQLDPEKVLSRPGDDLLWLRTITTNHIWVDENGTIIHFNQALQYLGIETNKLLNAIIPKYLDNLGLLKKKGNVLSNTLTLGIFEDFITPEREEGAIPFETTIQRDITHTLDTSRAASIIAKSSGCGYVFAFPRFNDGDFFTHAYLSEYSQARQQRFSRSDRYCDIELAARLRRQSQFNMNAWPPQAAPNDEMLDIFQRAMVAKDTGSLIFHSEAGARVQAWSFRPGSPAIFSAIGRSRGHGIGQLFVSMLFPVLVGYGILLIMVLSLLFAEFIIKPVKIFSDGVARLSKEDYGVLIEKFSGDEFSLITSAFNKMSGALRQREMIKRLVSAKLIERVEGTPGAKVTGSDMQVVSVLASDIRGFTSISEKYAPSEVVELLNTYFTAMEAAISENSGVIDKYIGDAIQVVFYEKAGLAPVGQRACQTALAMRRQLFALNGQRARQNLFALENGIGITTGQAISGSIGSTNGRKDFTIIGRITEQAAHLEAMTVHTTSRILVCNASRAALNDAFRLTRHNDESWELLDGN